MIYKSNIITQASGSVGGTTYAHNQGGLYMRARAIPTNPATKYQTEVRDAIRSLTVRWSQTLTAAQRQAWQTYAINVPLPNALGDSRTIGAIAMYTRSNVPRLQAGLAVVDDGPTVMVLPDTGDVTIDITAGEPASASVSYNDSHDWVSEDGAALLVYSSRPQSPAVNYFKGPWRYAGSILGNSETSPDSPQTVTLAFDATTTNHVFTYSRLTRADGRLSSLYRFPVALPAAP